MKPDVAISNQIKTIEIDKLNWIKKRVILNVCCFVINHFLLWCHALCVIKFLCKDTRVLLRYEGNWNQASTTALSRSWNPSGGNSSPSVNAVFFIFYTEVAWANALEPVLAVAGSTKMALINNMDDCESTARYKTLSIQTILEICWSYPWLYVLSLASPECLTGAERLGRANGC